ncbi:hypothetical protein [Glutamicibacter sp. X7]
MSNVVLVPGAGVRGSLRENFERQAGEQILRLRPKARITTIAWSDELGARLLGGGESIPEFRGSIAAHLEMPDTQDDGMLRVWSMLDIDPLAELKARYSPVDPGSAASETVEIGEIAVRLEQSAEVHACLKKLHLEASFSAAMTVARSYDAYFAAAHTPTPHTGALARALTAAIIKANDTTLGGLTAVDGVHRRELEEAIAHAITTDHRQVPTALSLTDWLLQLATDWIARYRAELTRFAAPYFGDLTMYLSRGAAIRKLIKDHIDALPAGPTSIVAHSLGAVACLDLLLSADLAPVQEFISAGSPAGLLFELNSLPSLPYTPDFHPPAGFPRVSNVYDPRDLLASRNASFFGPTSRDYPVDTEAPFPRNHGAYFGHQPFYELLDQLLPH